MLAEMLQQLDSMSHAARDPKIIRLGGETSNVYRILDHEGRVRVIRAEAIMGRRTFITIDSFIRYMQSLDLTQTPCEAVYYTSRRIHAEILVGDYGSIVAEIYLAPSEEIQFLARCMEDPIIAPDELRAALRYTLADAVVDPELEHKVGKVEFRITGENRTDLTRGKESLGKSLENEANAPNMPDEKQWFNVRAFANPDLSDRLELVCRLDPAMKRQAWHFQPVESSLAAFHDQALEQMVGGPLRSELGEKLPVYAGHTDRNVHMRTRCDNVEELTRSVPDARLAEEN